MHRSPFNNRKGPNGRPYELIGSLDSDISFVSSGRPSIDNLFPANFHESFETGTTPPRLSSFSEMENQSFDLGYPGRRSVDTLTPPDSSYVSTDSMVRESLILSANTYLLI